MHRSNTTTPTQSGERHFQPREIKGVQHCFFFFHILTQMEFGEEDMSWLRNIIHICTSVFACVGGIARVPVCQQVRVGDVHVLLKAYTAP